MIARVFWAAVLAGCLGFAFYRSWGYEHGKSPAGLLGKPPDGKETIVWLPATTLPAIMLTVLIMLMISSGAEQGLARFSAFTLDVIFVISAYFLLLTAALPLLRRHFSARACAVMWMVPVFIFYNVSMLFRTHMPLPRFTVYLPPAILRAGRWVWLAGFLLVLGGYTLSHLLFHRRMTASCRTVTEAETIALWEEARARLCYKKPVRLLLSPAASAPFSMGRTRRTRCTVLPQRAYSPEELRMIFAHELHHLQRGDVDTKVFLVFCRALCWFNPLVWLAVRRASEDLELSCDEIVTEHMDRTGRGSYARLLLSSAAPSQGYTTCLSSTADGLRYRIHSILNRPRRRRGTALLMAALFLCTVSFGFVTMTDARGPFTWQILSGFEIRSVSFQGENSSGFSPVSTWDEDALLHCLDGLDTEHIAGPGNYAHPSAGPSLSLSGSRADSWQFITLYDGVAVVAGRNTEDYYLVTGDIPWASIQACLSL